MKKDKPNTDEDKTGPESETEEMTTLFSSDNTELTDFTHRVKQASRSELSGRLGDKTTKQVKKPTSFSNNVINLFKPK